MTLIGSLTKHIAVDTKANILALSGSALHGHLYFSNNSLDIWIGDKDGGLKKIAGSSMWSLTDGVSTIDILETLNIVKGPLINLNLNSGTKTLTIGLDTTGAVNNTIPVYNAGTITWAAFPANYIGLVTDTDTIDLNVDGSGILTGNAIISATANNNIINSTGLYAPKLTINPSSTDRLSINGSYQLALSPLAIIDVAVIPGTYLSIGDWVSTQYTLGNYQEGDTIILTITGSGLKEVWLNNGAALGTTADWSKVSNGLEDASIRALFSGVTPLVYNTITGQFSLNGLSGYGSANQLVRTTGSALEYWSPTYVSQAYSTVKNSAGTAQTQRSILKFSSDFSPADTGGETVVSLGTKLANLSALAGNGIVVQTAANTFANRTITGTTDRVTIVNGDGISGNPTIDIASTYVGQTSITTLGTIGTGTWNATNISLAKGGTGSTLVDPNADRIMFWDDSANKVDWLNLDSSLAITGTTLGLASGFGSNAFFTLNTSTKADGATGSIYHNGVQIIGNASTGYTLMGNNVMQEVVGGIASIGVNSKIVLQAPLGGLWKITVNDAGILSIVAA